MAWSDEMPLLVRILVNDNNPTSQTYTDDQLELLIISAARTVLSEIDFDNTYSLSIDLQTITPDPTDSPEDSAFISLVSMKAACLLLASEVKLAANSSFIVKDGPSSIDTRANFEALLSYYKTVLDDYGRMKIAFQAGNSRAGLAVLGPYVEESTFPYWGNLN